MTEKPHLSPGQLDLICKCGEAYRRRYIEHEVRPPAMAMHKGTGVHTGAEVNFTQKIESYRDLPEREIVDAACAAFEQATEKRGYELNPDEAARGATVVVAEALDDTAAMAKAYSRKIAPEHQPILVEEPVRIELDGPHDLFGYVDLVSTVPVQVSEHLGQLEFDPNGLPLSVVDFKTSSRRKNQSDVDDSAQLTFYAAAAQLILGTPVDEVMLDVLVKGKSRVTRQVLRSTRGQPDFDALMHRVSMVQRAVSSGVFLPATPGAWWCSPKWCGYWSTCDFVNKERT